MHHHSFIRTEGDEANLNLFSITFRYQDLLLYLQHKNSYPVVSLFICDVLYPDLASLLEALLMIIRINSARNSFLIDAVYLFQDCGINKYILNFLFTSTEFNH